MAGPKRTQKYVAALGARKDVAAAGNALVVRRNGTADDLYSELEQAGYWWDSQSGAWKKREAHQNTRGGYSTENGVYRIRVMCHELDVEKVCKKIAAEHTVIDMSNPYPNDRKGNPEIVRVYFTLLLKD